MSKFFSSGNHSPGEIDPFNGSKLNGVYFPDEVLEVILVHMEIRTLLASRRVCKKWKSLIETQVLKERAILEGITWGLTNENKMNVQWTTWYLMLSPNSLFNRNLMKNPCGQDKFNSWEILNNGGNGWKVETPPLDTKDSNKATSSTNTESCFVTSYGRCSKQQWIDLGKRKTMLDVIERLKPAIVYSEWFCRRFDCGGRYDLRVALLNKAKKLLAYHIHHTDIGENFQWQKVENKFENYPSGVRYILFIHEGVDPQFFQGHYGPKMTRATVILIPPGQSYSIRTDGNIPIQSDYTSPSAEGVDLELMRQDQLEPGFMRYQELEIMERLEREEWEREERRRIEEEEEEERRWEEEEEEEEEREEMERMEREEREREERRRIEYEEERRREEEMERTGREENGEGREEEGGIRRRGETDENGEGRKGERREEKD
ncbi:hypothetical protein M8J76_007122 [Diaphorina citri]|nr:hypothetical protein M8J76_007122 [Diaphorina citri]